MMRTYLWILLFFGLGSAFAQNRAADSIQKILKSEHNEVNRVHLLNALSDAYKPSMPEKMRQFGQQALELSQKIDDKKGQGDAYINLGNSFVLQSDYRKALTLFQKAKEIFETENQSDPEVKIGLAKSLGSLGIIFSEQSNYTKALEFYLKSVTIYEAIGDQDRCAKLFNNIGVIPIPKILLQGLVLFCQDRENFKEKARSYTRCHLYQYWKFLHGIRTA